MKRVILLVEDNPVDEELTLRAMRNLPPNTVVVNAYDGAEALDILNGTGARGACGDATIPQLILLDLTLPKLNGLEVLQRIKKDARLRSIPVVMLTASGQEQDIYDAYCHGANGYLQKRLDYGEFCRDMGQLMSYWLDLNQMLPTGLYPPRPF